MEWRELLAAAASVFITSLFVWKWLKRRKVHDKADNSQTVLPEKSQSIPQPSPKKKDDFPTKPTSYVNDAYRETEASVSTPGQVQSSETVLKVASQLKERNISDVSEVFRPPSPEAKTLSDIMLEKYDRKSKTLRSEDLQDIDFNEMDNLTDDVSSRQEQMANEGAPSNQEESNLNAEITAESHSSFNQTTHLHDVTDGVRTPAIAQQRPPTINNTEWRDKLRLDLDGDDDEEFIDESSSEEEKFDYDDNKSIEVNFEDDSKNVENLDYDDDNDASSDDDKGDEDEHTKGSSIVKERSESLSSKTDHDIPLVIDNGSYIVRGGWGGEYAPTSCVRNVIGSWRAEASEAWQEALGSKFIGQTAIDRHTTLALENPIEDGKIENWRGVQDVIQHVVGKELEADLTQHPVLITEAATADKKQREKMTEIMIESLRVGGVCLKPQAAMCSLSAGHAVGLVINSGYGTTEIVPVYSGYALPFATTTLNIGGRHITDYLARLSQRERGHTFTSVAEMEIINTVKERFAKVLINNRDIENQTNSPIEYPLPDGRVIEFGSELSNCAEPLFSPGLVGCSSIGLPALVKQSLDMLDPDIMKAAENTILLAGGNSNLTGLQSRLEADFSASVNGFKTSLKRTTCSDNAAWIGGSLFTQQPGFIDLCITEDLYFEHGAQLVHKLCF